MESFLIYLAKSGIVLAAFVALFALLMRNETFHRINRVVLLSTVALSLLLPAVNLGIESPLGKLFAREEAPTAIVEIPARETLAIVESLPTASTSESIEFTDVFAIIYLIGIAVMLARMCIMYTGVIRIIAKAGKAEHLPCACRNISLRISDEEITPFSWMRWVVISKNERGSEAAAIITHETAHARALHSIDIAFMELTLVLQWFNPAAWAAKKMIKEIHEFEADTAVISSGTPAREYQQLIIKKAVGARLYSIANSFNHSLTKRITMMCKEKSKSWRCAKALYIVPAATIAALLFSQPENANAIEQPSDGKVTNFLTNGKQSKEYIFPAAEITRELPATPIASKALPADTTHTAKNDQEVFQVVEQQPEFPGGMSALMKHLSKTVIYPQEARDILAEGRCIVQFTVNKDGSISDVKVVKSSGNEHLDKEAVRVVSSMPAWKPGTMHGETVNVKHTLPISFRLSPNKKEVPAIIFGAEDDIEKVINSDSPLLVINGAIYEGNAGILSNFKPEDVESITTLQEKEAVSLYGEKGKNGAIIIELKKRTTYEGETPKASLDELKQKAQDALTAYEEALRNESRKRIYSFNTEVTPSHTDATLHTDTGKDKVELKNAQLYTSTEGYDRAAVFTGEMSSFRISNHEVIKRSGFAEGKTILEFNVEENGTITKAKVKNSCGNADIDEVALEALKNTQGLWSPAMKEGKAVRSAVVIAVSFKTQRS